MSKYRTKYCTVYDCADEPESLKKTSYHVKIALDSWDGTEDAEDESIFFYMDGEPLELGMIISEGFLVTHIDEETNMTAAELIKLLKKIPPDTHVFGYLNGDRHAIESIDLDMWDHFHADINFKPA
jgi:hypothetical protein